MMEGFREQLECGEEVVVGFGEEGERGEDVVVGFGEGGEKGEDIDEDLDLDCLKGFIGYFLDIDFVESLFVKVKYRVLVFKKFQIRVVNLEFKFLREFYDIERKFVELY